MLQKRAEHEQSEKTDYLNDMRKEVDTLKSTIETLQAENVSLKQADSAHASDLKRAEDAQEALREEAELLKAQVDEVQGEAARNRRERDRFEGEIRELQGQLEREKEEGDRARRAKESEVNEREKAVARFKKEMKELRDEQRKGREERDHYAGLLQRNSDEFGKMKQSLQKAEANALAKAHKLEEEKAKLEEEIEQLREAREEQEEAESADSLFRVKEQLLELEREKEFEMKKLLEENQRLNAEITRLLTENGECAGHSNPS